MGESGKNNTPKTSGRRLFTKGTPGPGRPKGVPNKVTLEAKEAAAKIVDDPTYRQNLLGRALSGSLAPGIEQMLWHYAKGVPKQTIGVEGGETPVLTRIEHVIIDAGSSD